jgi:hypothetical protein
MVDVFKSGVVPGMLMSNVFIPFVKESTFESLAEVLSLEFSGGSGVDRGGVERFDLNIFQKTSIPKIRFTYPGVVWERGVSGAGLGV